MRKTLMILASILFILITNFQYSSAQEGLIPAFKIEKNPLALERLAKPGTPFDKLGRKFALLGEESGSFEAWAYPLKLLRNFEFSFFVGSSTRPLLAKDIVRTISVSPEATTLTYTYQSFTVQAIYITPIKEPGAVILLEVDSTVPLSIVCGFLPVLQPMWPAGLGGQYAYWDEKQKAYIISESSGKNHGLIGSPAASGLSSTPAHMLSDAPNEFKIEIPKPEKVRGQYIPICIAGGKGQREEILKIFKRLQNNPEELYRKNLDHYRDLSQNTLRVQTPCADLNLAFEWAKVAYDNLVVDNPDLGRGLVAGLGASGTSGRPGFGWFFGGDAYINIFSLLSYGASSTARDALAFTQKWQREDGKMAHELSQAAGYIDWWEDYHFGYIHADTTPYYIIAMDEYLKMSGDELFIKESWESLKRAYDWCLSTDGNGDGLMDNRKAGLGAMEYGALTGIETDVYLAAIWTRAAQVMQNLARVVGEEDYVRNAASHFEKAKKAFQQKFWDEEQAFYVYAFNADGERIQEISPWCAVGLMWDLGTPEGSLRSLQKLNSSELTTDWGTRSLSIKSPHYKPLGYNYGAVWPFITSWTATAQFQHYFHLQGFSSLMATVQHTFDEALGCVTEVLSGSQNVRLQESVSHQGFSTAGVVLPLVRGLSGLEGDALKKSIRFAPRFPADWEKVSIENYRLGEALFSFDYEKTQDKIMVSVRSKNSEGYRLHFAPGLGIGSRIQSLVVDGKTIPFKPRNMNQITEAEADLPVERESMVLNLEFEPTAEILPPVLETKAGARNKGLKIISILREDKKLRVKLEGLAEEEYELQVWNPEFLEKVEGAVLQDDKLSFVMPTGKTGTFVPHQITLILSQLGGDFESPSNARRLAASPSRPPACDQRGIPPWIPPTIGSPRQTAGHINRSSAWRGL